MAMKSKTAALTGAKGVSSVVICPVNESMLSTSNVR